MNKDNIKEYIVCVNGGSGVIFQPKNEVYSYILTAKHVFDDIAQYENKVIIERFDPESNNFISIDKFGLILNINYFPHKTKDIAILKCPRVKGAERLIRFDSLNSIVSINSGIALYGFPEIRRKNDIYLDRIREDLNLSISIEKSEGKREAALADNSTWEELVGQSGGGIFCFQGDYLGLLGIQNKVPSREESKGRIEFSPLHNFDEIINDSNGKLEKLIPTYLKSFSFLKDDVFLFSSDLITKETIDKITTVLKVKTSEIIKCDFTPSCIKEYLGKTELLIYNQKEELLNEKALWLIWLELLTILNIVKNKRHAKSDFNELFSQVRLLHSNTDKDFWVDNIDNVAKTNFGNLSKDGLVVVSSKQPPHKDHYILDTTAILPKIDQIRFEYKSDEMPYGKENDNITSGYNFPFDNFQFVHIEYFKQKLVVDEFSDFSTLTHEQILLLLKKKYDEIIK